MNYVLMLVGGLLGAFIHILVKIRSINKRLENETFKSVFIAYWRMDYISVMITFTVIVTAMFLSSEYLQIKDTDKIPANLHEMLQYKISQFLKTTFAVIGYCADAIVNATFGVTEKKLQTRAKDGGVIAELN